MTMPYTPPVPYAPPLPTPTPRPLVTATPTPAPPVSAARIGVSSPAYLPYPPPAKEGPESNLTFTEFLDASGLTDMYYNGTAARKKWIEDQYVLYAGMETPEELTGEAAGGAAAAPLFSPEEERLMTDLDNAIKVGQLDQDQAWKVIENYWMEEDARQGRAEIATTRGQELLSGAFPGTTLPMTGPGGMGESLQKQYGLPNLTPAVKGLPMEQALGVFGQAQQQMGLPATLSPLQAPNLQLPNWQALGQNLPTFGVGGNKYIEQLLQEGRSTAPTL